MIQRIILTAATLTDTKGLLKGFYPNIDKIINGGDITSIVGNRCRETFVVYDDILNYLTGRNNGFSSTDNLWLSNAERKREWFIQRALLEQ